MSDKYVFFHEKGCIHHQECFTHVPEPEDLAKLFIKEMLHINNFVPEMENLRAEVIDADTARKLNHIFNMDAPNRDGEVYLIHEVFNRIFGGFSEQTFDLSAWSYLTNTIEE